MIIPKACRNTQAVITFFISRVYAYLCCGWGTVLQLPSFMWPMLDVAGFQEVYYFHSITAYQVGVCHSAA
jgi:hypothetical protein